MIEKRIEVKGKNGVDSHLAAMIARRLSCLGPTTCWLFRPDGEGLEWSCDMPASYRLMRELMRLEVPHGATVKLKATGPQAETAIGEIEHLCQHYDVADEGACLYADEGPRGPWPNIPLHMFGHALQTTWFDSRYKEEPFMRAKPGAAWEMIGA